ncbi:MAG: MoaD/ThiS family protein [Deltaproteobacteria bacterium]|nr:MoaD/ThiS family protein [Deltaproteobacteria bacterium]
MKVIIRNPKRREIEVEGKRQVRDLLRELNLNPESVLVIRNGALLTRDEMAEAGDTIEILSAISGG